MSTPSRDLWPDDIGATSVVPPLAILREQGAVLGQKTQGLLEGQVRSGPCLLTRKGKGFEHSFLITAPALNYQYHLLTVRHPVDLYPVNVRYLPTSEEFPAMSEEEFVDILANVFGHPETKRIIEALLAQIEQ